MAGWAEKCYDGIMEIGVCQPNTTDRTAPRGRERTILLYLLGFLLALGVFLLWVYHGVTPVVQAEYGAGVPPVSAFCAQEDAFLLADESGVRLGRHWVQVITGHRVVPCLLIVRDTAAPAAVPVRVSFASGYTPTPDEFITDLVDADRVGVSFAQTYDFSEPGEQPVVIHLEDGSGNNSEVTATAAVHAGVDRVVVEAGGPAPTDDDFCGEGFHGKLLDPITDEMLHQPGEYLLRIECRENGRVFPATLVVRDTAAPVAAGKLVILRPGEDAAPEAFLTDVTDETTLTFAFAQAPDPNSREIQDVLIRVTDAGGNSVDVAAQALYSSLGAVTVEAKNGLLTGEDLSFPNAEPEAFSANMPGTYPVQVKIDGQTEIALVTLADTISPALTLREGPFYTHHDLTPEQLIAAEDVTEVTLSFVQAPDPASAAPQTFSVLAVDAAGNETTAAFPLTLLVDSTPPSLFGVVDRICYVGEPILYLQEAYAEDDVDGRVALQVDSQVVLSKKGNYSVTFTAADESGNTVSKTVTYTLVTPTTSTEQLDALTDAVLEKIIQPDMVTAEKLRAVFDYVQKQVKYVGTSDKTDWRKEAVRGLTKGKGDCFTFYSVSRVLLDKLNIPYMSVTRKGGASRHYWLIVNIGTGWYHFDSLVNHVLPYKCFMWTNQQLKKMPPHFWRFAEENYPPIATEPFDYKAVVQMEREGLLP